MTKIYIDWIENLKVSDHVMVIDILEKRLHKVSRLTKCQVVLERVSDGILLKYWKHTNRPVASYEFDFSRMEEVSAEKVSQIMKNNINT